MAKSLIDAWHAVYDGKTLATITEACMDPTIRAIRYLLIGLGSCLLVAATGLLLWCVLLFQELLTTPDKVGIVMYIQAQMEAQGVFVSGSLDGADFQVTLSDTAKGFGFMLLGLLALSVLASIVKALIVGGVEIIKGAAAMQTRAEDNGAGQARKDVHVHKVVR